MNARPPGRHWRLSRLPPGAPVVVPDGLPLFWDARLAFARLCQVYRRVIQAPTLPDGYRWRSGRLPAVVKELARDCRITVGPWPSRVVTRCPTCGAEAYLLPTRHGAWLGLPSLLHRPLFPLLVRAPSPGGPTP